MSAAVFDTSWYVEQEGRIQAADRESARLRWEMRRRFDPGHLYVVQFESGVLKVGKSARPEKRLANHAKTGPVVDSWVSAHHLGISVTEGEVIKYCNESGALFAGREYFSGLQFWPVVCRSMLVVDDAISRGDVA